MTSHSSQNEGFRLLDELVCQAIPGPAFRDLQTGKSVESRGENEGIRVCEQPCSDVPPTSSKNDNLQAGGCSNAAHADDVPMGADGPVIVFADRDSQTGDILVGGFFPDRSAGQVPDVVDLAIHNLGVRTGSDSSLAPDRVLGVYRFDPSIAGSGPETSDAPDRANIAMHQLKALLTDTTGDVRFVPLASLSTTQLLALLAVLPPFDRWNESELEQFREIAIERLARLAKEMNLANHLISACNAIEATIHGGMVRSP